MLDFPMLRRGGRLRRPALPRAQVATIPAPIGGWNARDALPAMPVTDAITLDNFIPGNGGVRLRKGFAEHVAALGSYVETLMTYAAPGVSEKLFAAIPTEIYDVTAAGSGVSAVTGLTNGRWQHLMFTALSGTSYLVACNGADDTRIYDGSSWGTAAFTGVALSALVNVTVHLNRLWFVQDNTLDAWYLGAGAITGAATKFSIGPYCTLGGELLAIASWTRDGGAGMDDVIVFITTKGEAVIYSGTDPASASTWAKVGTFKIPEPVGRSCVEKIGADVGIITSQGVVPLSGLLTESTAATAKVAATDKIRGAFTEVYEGLKTAHGWQLIEYPKEQILIVNVPVVERVTTHQYVMATQGGAWCRFTGMNAGCWALLGDVLYFGGHDGKIYKYGEVYSDAGTAINAVAISAFTNLDSDAYKIFSMARAMLYGPADYIPLIALRTDFDIGEIEYSATSSVTAGSFWDESEWDVAEWGLGIVPSSVKQSVEGHGTWVSVALAVAVTEEMRFNAVMLMYEPGNEW